MPVEPDLIHESGSENIPMGDRAGLLAYNRMCLERLAGNGMEAHDRANLLEVVTLLLHCWSKPCLHDVFAREISEVECLVMAWKRGGHSEYQRVRKAQKK